ncbi:MAG: Asp-tRNA(Asn)/Glu-tRNA(Gln) amidotransferase subunit GatA [Flavobacteriales bacterium]|nr:Asp-tRNA(Asn)/Glu-tRNA(Gln) amidotransferase subunit GatA [Flavobacteriales bacterium]
MDIPESLEEIQKKIKNGECTLVQICKEYIQRINLSENNAFIEVFEEEALEKAQKIQSKISANNAGILAGMFIGIKDNICYKNHQVTASSKILNGFESKFSATAVKKILNEDGIIIGRLNCDEFAMGSSNEKSFYGPVKNPCNSKKVPGGSSGGSAAAIAEKLCTATLGSDTGGSVRQPASFCGVIGYKPTYGRVSRNGLIAYGSSFDQIGVFAKTVQDTNLISHVISGADKYDSTVTTKETHKKDIQSLQKKIKIGIPEEYLNFDNLDLEIKNRLLNIVENLKSKGHEIELLKFPYIDYIVPTYYVLSTAEASSNLSRYDGAHFGFRSTEANDIESTYENTRSEGFGMEVKRRIMLGNFVLSSGYYDAYFTKAQKVRRMIADKTTQMLQNNDVLLFPTTPTTAFNIGEIKDPVTMYLQDIFTVHANIVGLPAISLPIGQHSNKMPFGVQLMTNKFKEEKLFEISQFMMETFYKK